MSVFDDTGPEIARNLTTEGYLELDGSDADGSPISPVCSAPSQFIVLAGRAEIDTGGRRRADPGARRRPQVLLLAGRSWLNTPTD
ncbi:hypothetical protein ACFOWZ_07985 [Lentzea rhizosphaerae]|uniref:Uncharacterized protein n=1 Tax=Lentzea rhizosphaerae TaxID=2041025 RepID=A0ABV8BPX9_9PSEU